MRSRGALRYWSYGGGIALFALSACGSDPSPAPAPNPIAEKPSRDTRFTTRDSFAWPVAGGKPRTGETVESEAKRYAAELAASGPRGARQPTLEVRNVHDLGRGPLIVRLAQRFDGVEVFQGDLRVLMRQDRSLVTIAGQIADVRSDTSHAFVSVAFDALAAAFTAALGTSLQGPAASLGTRDDYALFDLAAMLSSSSDFEPSAPARVKPVLFREGQRLVPAYYVEILGERRSDGVQLAFGLVVADSDLRILQRQNLVRSDTFNYRVFATNGGDFRPLDAPTADTSPHPTGMPDGQFPAAVAPVLVAVEGLNTNPGGLADPWLANGATQTLGNNVDAYADFNFPNGFGGLDVRASVTSAGTFDRTYNQALEPSASSAQRMASVTQLFYATNWLHDWYYDSGFDEAAGNAQQSNFGRGGLQGDRLLAEAQDNSGTSNANISVPADGQSPRMQMYLWDAPPKHTLVATPSGSSYATGTATFGPQTFELMDQLVVASPADGCSAVSNGSGSIVLVDRGSCNFIVKAQNAQAGGAVGILIADNVAAAVPPAMDGSGGPAVTIPVFSVTQAGGADLKTKVAGGSVSVQMTREPTPTRDASFDFAIVAHEFGHLVFHRLLGACVNAQCNALSEGWGDIVALHAILKSGDDPSGAYPVGAYSALAIADSYFGVRRAPYSTDPAKNALSFRHITLNAPLPSHPLAFAGDNTEPHSAGEVFAAMGFEAYAALLDAHPYEEARRRMSDYVVAAMAMTPSDPTFLEQRDALLAVAGAADPADAILLAQAFAVRGAGTCAVGPVRTSTNLDGIVEKFELAPLVGGVDVELTDGDPSCDEDGVLDAGEAGKVSVSLANVGPVELDGGTLTLSSDTPGVTFPDPSVPIPTVDAFDNGSVEVDVVLDPGFVGQVLALDVEVSAPGACSVTSVSKSVIVNVDQTPNASTVDQVEAIETEWTLTGQGADAVWSRQLGTAPDHVWLGVGPGEVSDTALVSPPLEVNASGSFGVGFSHRYDFEFSNPGTYWDGGVIEISADGGPWVDVSTYASPGYSGTIFSGAGNPLAGRQAYGRRNSAWPNENNVSLNLGTGLAGKTVRVRFRIGTDEAQSSPGWTIDNIAFSGIANQPFTQVVPDGCPPDGEGGSGGTASGGTGGNAGNGGVSGAGAGNGGSAGSSSGDAGGEGGSPNGETGGSSGSANAGGSGPEPSGNEGGEGAVDASGGSSTSSGGSSTSGQGAGASGSGGSGTKPKSGESEEESSCGCRTVGRQRSTLGWMPAALLGLVFARRRPRRGRMA